MVELIFDAEGMMDEAASSRDGEAFRVLFHDEGVRLGVGARAKGNSDRSLFAEFMLFLSLRGSGEGLEGAEGQLQLLRALIRDGFEVTHRDASCVSCERVLDLLKVDQEVHDLMAMLRKRSKQME